MSKFQLPGVIILVLIIVLICSLFAFSDYKSLKHGHPTDPYTKPAHKAQASAAAAAAANATAGAANATGAVANSMMTTVAAPIGTVDLKNISKDVTLCTTISKPKPKCSTIVKCPCTCKPKPSCKPVRRPPPPPPKPVKPKPTCQPRNPRSCTDHGIIKHQREMALKEHRKRCGPQRVDAIVLKRDVPEGETISFRGPEEIVCTCRRPKRAVQRCFPRCKSCEDHMEQPKPIVFPKCADCVDEKPKPKCPPKPIAFPPCPACEHPKPKPSCPPNTRPFVVQKAEPAKPLPPAPQSKCNKPAPPAVADLPKCNKPKPSAVVVAPASPVAPKKCGCKKQAMMGPAMPVRRARCDRAADLKSDSKPLMDERRDNAVNNFGDLKNADVGNANPMDSMNSLAGVGFGSPFLSQQDLNALLGGDGGLSRGFSSSASSSVNDFGGSPFPASSSDQQQAASIQYNSHTFDDKQGRTHKIHTRVRQQDNEKGTEHHIKVREHLIREANGSEFEPNADQTTEVRQRLLSAANGGPFAKYDGVEDGPSRVFRGREYKCWLNVPQRAAFNPKLHSKLRDVIIQVPKDRDGRPLPLSDDTRVTVCARMQV